jgi:hypothetical protein
MYRHHGYEVAHQEQATRSRRRAARIAYQGVEGGYSHLAAQRRYGGRPRHPLPGTTVSLRRDAVMSGADPRAPIEHHPGSAATTTICSRQALHHRRGSRRSSTACSRCPA